jgi:hypothetical protein
MHGFNGFVHAWFELKLTLFKLYMFGRFRERKRRSTKRTERGKRGWKNVLALSTWNLVACPVDHQERLALDDNHEHAGPR